MNITLFDLAIVIGVIVSAFSGGILAQIMYITYERHAILHKTMAVFAALACGFFGYKYFGSSGALLGIAGLAIGVIAAKASVAIDKDTTVWGESNQRSAFNSVEDEQSFQKFVINAGVFINAVVGGFATYFLVPAIGAWSLLVVAVGSTAFIVALAGMLFWFVFVILTACWTFQKFCQFAAATAIKLTERV